MLWSCPLGLRLTLSGDLQEGVNGIQFTVLGLSRLPAACSGELTQWNPPSLICACKN
jgi:hypothetical protein